MWYSRAKIVSPEQVRQHPSGWVHLDWRCTVSTVPSRARKSKRYTIYALIDPRFSSEPVTIAVRYIGITEDVYQRMRQHSRCEGNNVEKNAWIEELQKEQLMFIMHSLEKVKTLAEALAREQHWIQHYLQQGAKLTNVAGVPEDPSKPAEKKLQPFSYEHLATLYFKTADNRVVSLMRSTNRDFDAFIRHYVNLAEEWDVEDWSEDWRRKQVMNHLYRNGMEIELFDTPQDGEGKYLWLVERDPNPPEIIA